MPNTVIYMLHCNSICGFEVFQSRAGGKSAINASDHQESYGYVQTDVEVKKAWNVNGLHLRQMQNKFVLSD